MNGHNISRNIDYIKKYFIFSVAMYNTKKPFKCWYMSDCDKPCKSMCPV